MTAVTTLPTATPIKPVRSRHRRGAARWVILAVVAFGALLVLIPFGFMLLNAFKSATVRSVGPPGSTPRA